MNAFIASCSRHGRGNKKAVVEEVARHIGKPEREIGRYFATFWGTHPFGKDGGSSSSSSSARKSGGSYREGRYKELPDWEIHLKRVERGEVRIQKQAEIVDMIQRKIARCRGDPLESLSIDYGHTTMAGYSEKEDRYLVVKINELGLDQVSE